MLIDLELEEVFMMARDPKILKQNCEEALILLRKLNKDIFDKPVKPVTVNKPTPLKLSSNEWKADPRDLPPTPKSE